MQAHVFDSGESSAPFPVTIGEKKAACWLFSMMFSVMLTDAFYDSDPGIDSRYRTDGKRRLRAKTKIHVDRLREFLFANDCTLNTGNKADIQRSMDLLSSSCYLVCIKLF